jgi:hypothetical protein
VRTTFRKAKAPGAGTILGREDDNRSIANVTFSEEAGQAGGARTGWRKWLRGDLNRGSPWQNSAGLLRFLFRPLGSKLLETSMKKEIKKKRYGKKKRRKQS